MKVLIAAGGTGGHLFPGIALARELRKRGCDPFFVGTSRVEEREILEREKFSHLTLSIRGMRRFKDLKIQRSKDLFFNLFLFPLFLLLSLVQSLWILLLERPEGVVGMGGYLSFPILFLGWFLGKHTLISEQNFQPGLTTRLLSSFVNEIHLSFEGSRSFLPWGRLTYNLSRKRGIFVTGNPVRREIAQCPKKEVRPQKTVLLFGGSQGARSINRAFLDALPFFSVRRLEDLKIKDFDFTSSQVESLIFNLRFILQTGKEEFPLVKSRIKDVEIRDRITLTPFIEDMAVAYGQADLVVSRAGATTCAEITAMGIPALLIPYPHAAEGHQKRNAQFLKERGAAEVIQNGELTGKRLAEIILTLLHDGKSLQEMGQRSKRLGRPEAAQKLADRVLRWGASS